MSSNSVKTLVLLVVSVLVGVAIGRSDLDSTPVVKPQEKVEVEIVKPTTSLETTKTVGGTTTVSNSQWGGVPAEVVGADKTKAKSNLNQ